MNRVCNCAGYLTNPCNIFRQDLQDNIHYGPGYPYNPWKPIPYEPIVIPQPPQPNYNEWIFPVLDEEKIKEIIKETLKEMNEKENPVDVSEVETYLCFDVEVAEYKDYSNNTYDLSWTVYECGEDFDKPIDSGNFSYPTFEEVISKINELREKYGEKNL